MEQIGNALGKLTWEKRACAVFVLCAATAITLPAQTFTSLHSFDIADGGYPRSGLVQATDGDLYGTSSNGGANCAPYGCGTVFKITPSGTLTTLYSFCSQGGTNCTDGEYPDAGLVQATNGDFYGTTSVGGGSQSPCPGTVVVGCGTLFEITPGGTLTTLYTFCSQSGCTDGANPQGGLVQATDGNFYGTTRNGGVFNFCLSFAGCGTVFKISPSGTLTTLYSFCAQYGCTDGVYPDAALVQGTDGNFYGTTYNGGANGGGGTVYKITPTGTLTTLYSFCGETACADGFEPDATLIQATNGDFYGTTYGGGANNYGTVFKVTPSGSLTTLYSFCSQSGCTDGAILQGGLVQATDGNFYGTTEYGGAKDDGTVFKITPSGALTTLYGFCPQSGCADGEYPQSGLVQHTNGDFYGTTYRGGANGDGTVFSLSVGLGQFVEIVPTSGNVGTAVNILGTNLTGASTVTFNGTAAVFTVVSPSLITTAVPVGSTTS